MANIQSFKGLNPSKRSFFSWRDRSAPAGGWQVFICRRFSLSGSNAPAGGCRTVVCCRLSLAPRLRLVFVDGPRLRPEPSMLEAGFCGWTSPRPPSHPRWRAVFVDETRVIHAGGLFLWMASSSLAYSFRFVPKIFGVIPKGLHRRRLECLVVGGEGSHPWPTPHFQIANTPQRDKCFINNILQNGSV